MFKLNNKVRKINTQDNYILDQKTQNLFKSLENNMRYNRQIKFRDWLEELEEYNDEISITNCDKIIIFYEELLTLLNNNGFYINNKKRFKNELASIIYNFSTK
tara:strand:+ start:723 stop:1031 length:309 start_codon:yes stop_codon:yes gene_type:complete